MPPFFQSSLSNAPSLRNNDQSAPTPSKVVFRLSYCCRLASICAWSAWDTHALISKPSAPHQCTISFYYILFIMGKLPQTTLLRRHLGFGDSPGLEPSFDTPPTSAVLFFIERAPHSPNGAKCRLATCPGQISPGEYRVALTPGMSGLVSVQAKVSGESSIHVASFKQARKQPTS